MHEQTARLAEDPEDPPPVSWKVGYPEKYGYLDDEHEELGGMLAALGEVSSNDYEKTRPRVLAHRLLEKLDAHMAHEEDVMGAFAYAGGDLHKEHHQALRTSLELILKLFDTPGMYEHGHRIAGHLESKLAEETLFDRQLAVFLRDHPSA